MGKFGLVSASLPGCGVFKNKETRLREKNENKFTNENTQQLYAHVSI